MKVILKRGGADLNERDEACGTPLLYACQNNAPDIVASSVSAPISGKKAFTSCCCLATMA